MKHKSMGGLPNAPLAYVIAQIAFDPILNIESKIPAIQEALRPSYPRMEIIKQNMEIATSTSATFELPPMWEFYTDNKTKAVRVLSNMVVIHATSYVDYQSFEHDIREVIDNVVQVLDGVWVKRQGMRYVDFLIPENNESVHDMVMDGLKSAPDIGIGSDHAAGVSVSQYGVEQGMLTIKYSFGKGKPSIPPELEPFLLEKSDIMNKDVSSQTETAIIDFDRFMQCDQRLEVNNIMKNFKAIHECLSNCFKTVTTETAKKKWRNNQ